MQGKFITIGDITSDAFIKLLDAKVHCGINDDNCTISMRWGDKIPYDSVTVVPAVGNSPNASVSLARLGADVSLVTFVGDDEHGKEATEVLRREGVDTSFITVEPGKQTNYHYVLSFGPERTILVRHEAFTYSLPNFPEDPEWLYFSSVGEAAEGFHDEVAAWLEAHPDTKLLFQPGTFQLKLGYERLKALYARSHLFVCNKEEAQSILGVKDDGYRTLLEKLHATGPDIVAITDGAEGASIFDGQNAYFIPMYPDIAPPKERTGCGDAFTSTLAHFLNKGLDLKDAFIRAPINSMSVVQQIGAQKGLLSEPEIEKYLEQAPEGYTVKEI